MKFRFETEEDRRTWAIIYDGKALTVTKVGNIVTDVTKHEPGFEAECDILGCCNPRSYMGEAQMHFQHVPEAMMFEAMQKWNSN